MAFISEEPACRPVYPALNPPTINWRDNILNSLTNSSPGIMIPECTIENQAFRAIPFQLEIGPLTESDIICILALPSLIYWIRLEHIM